MGFSPTLLSVHSTPSTWSVTLQDRFWMLLNTSTGVARSTSTWNHPTSLSALADLLEDPSRSSLPTLRLHRLLPAMELRSREHTTLTMLLPRSSRRPKPILSLMFGLLVFFSMSSCLDNFHSRESLPRRPRTTSSMSSSSLSMYKECTMEGTRLLMWVFKKAPIRRPSLEEVGAHRWMNAADYMLKKRERARFPTNRIQKFAKDYHKSRPAM